MTKISFNQDWYFYKKSSPDNKSLVCIPHDAMIFEERSADAESGIHGCYFLSDDYIYEKQFSLDDYEGQEAVFEFEGVYKDCEVYINDVLVKTHHYGYTGFYVAVNKADLHTGNNTIKVIARNNDQPNSRWYSGAGIYRPCYLHLLPEKHIELDGISVITKDYKRKCIYVEVKTNTIGLVRIEVLDGNQVIYDETVESSGQIHREIILKEALLWNEFNPKLYTLRASFEGHSKTVQFGIRQIECTPNEGLLINGERVIIKGCCIHHDNGMLGASSYEYAEERKIKIIKSAGYNAVRLAHNPSSKSLLDACDKHGIYVLNEYVDMWYIHKTKHDYANHVENNWRKDLKDIVTLSQNHPSVIMYSVGNEVAESAEERGIALCDEMVKYLHGLDETRPVTCGINIFFNYLYKLGFGVYTDQKAEKKQAVGSEFYNKLAGLLGDKTMKFGATLHGSDVNTKGIFEVLDVAGYNYGIGRYKKDLNKYPNRIILGTETFCSDARRFYTLAKQNKRIIGDFVWSGFDYLGEVGIGSWVYDDYAKNFNSGLGWMTAGSGRIDINGNTSGETLYTKVAFEKDVINVATVPPAYYKRKHSPSAWKMSDALPSWSYEGYEGKPISVEVYANCDKIELYVNDKCVKRKKMNSSSMVKFTTTYQKGTLKAVALDKSGNKIGESVLHSAEKQTILAAIPECTTLKKTDLLYVNVMFCDQYQNIKPLERREVSIEVKNGTLLAFGNACPFNDKGYHNTVCETYQGRAMAIIKPMESGDIEVNFKSSKGEDHCIVTVIEE